VFLAVGVQAGSRLVEEQDRGAHGEDAGEADALLLAEAQVVDRALAQVAGVGGLEGFLDASLDLEGAEAEIARAEGHVLLDRRGEELIARVLEDHADLLVQLGGAELPKVFAIERDGARLRGQQPQEHLDQRGLPGAVGAEQPDEFAGRSREIQVVQGASPIRIGEAHPARLNARRVVAHIGPPSQSRKHAARSASPAATASTSARRSGPGTGIGRTPQ